MSQTKAQLVSGTTAQDLTVDNINTTSVNSGQVFGRKNLLMNPGFTVFQRFLPGSQAAITGSYIYVMDRWFGRGENSSAVFNVTQTDIQSEGQNRHTSLKVTVTTSATPGSGDVFQVGQFIEGKNVNHINLGNSDCKPLTLSFYVKSSVTGTHSGSLMNNARDRSFPFSYTISSANTWEKKTISIPAITVGTWERGTSIGLRVYWDMGTGSAKRAAAGSWVNARAVGVTGAVQLVTTNSATWSLHSPQLEVGTTATDFEERSYPEEEAICQRYFYGHARGANNSIGVGVLYQDNNLFTFVKLPVEMRAAPTLEVSSGSGHFTAYSNGSNDDFNTFSGAWNITNTQASMNAYSADGLSGRSAGHAAMVITSNGDAHLGFKAEL